MGFSRAHAYLFGHQAPQAGLRPLIIEKLDSWQFEPSAQKLRQLLCVPGFSLTAQAAYVIERQQASLKFRYSSLCWTQPEGHPAFRIVQHKQDSKQESSSPLS